MASNCDLQEIKRLRRRKLKAQQRNDAKEEAELCNSIGDLLAKNGDFEEAIGEHQCELQLTESRGDVIGTAIANRKIGECYSGLACYEKALRYQKKHLELAKSVEDFLEEQRAWATLGRTYLMQAEGQTEAGSNRALHSLNNSSAAFHRSLDVCEKLRDQVGTKQYMEMRARLFLNLGLVFENQGNLEDCVKFIKQAVFIAERHSLWEDLYRSHLCLGLAHQKHRGHTKALRCLEAAIQVAKRLKETHLLSEALATTASSYLQLGDLGSARRVLKEAYKLGSRLPEDRHAVVTHLKQVVRLYRLDRRLTKLADTDYRGRLPLCEALGDACCKVNSFTLAINYYQQQLECGRQLGAPHTDLATICVSLAATHEDCAQYEKAVHYYHQELQYRPHNHQENTKTWLNIAHCQLQDRQPYQTLHRSHQQALQLAQKAGLPRLQLRALQSLAAVQRQCGERAALQETQDSLEGLEALHGGPADDEEGGRGRGVSDSDTVVESSGTNELLDNSIDLDALSDSSDDGEDEEDDEESGQGRSGRAKRRRKSQWQKLNEKGETPLHRAVIEGNLAKVKRLITEDGHPVNPRDYSGWIPLHEAANHGHPAIVELLLDRGAHINDRGGQHCDGVTPLHDALNCGNFEVAQLLVQRGANTAAKNDQGHTPLDSLVRWREAYAKDLDDETRALCHHTQTILTAGLGSGGTGNPGRVHFADDLDTVEEDSSCLDDDDDPDNRAPPRSRVTRSAVGQRSQVRQVHRRRACELSSATSDSDYCPSSTQDSLFTTEGATTTTEEGATTTTTEEGATTSDGGHETVTVTTTTEDDDEEEEEVVYVNPLLEGGKQANSATSAYRGAMAGLGSAATIAATSQPTAAGHVTGHVTSQPALIPEEEYAGDDWLVDDLDQPPSKRKRPALGVASGSGVGGRPTGKRRARQPKLTGMFRRAEGEGSEVAVDEEPAAEFAGDEGGQVVETTFNQNQWVPPPAPSSGPPPIRIRLRIKDKLFIVPINQQKTILDLCEEACRRYYQACGLRPNLLLATGEGALLASEDTVGDVLTPNEEVVGQVTSWDLPPLIDRYRKACQTSNIGCNQRVLAVLQASGGGAQSSLDLAHLGLPNHQAVPLFRALQCHYALTALLLPGNRVDDLGLSQLAAALPGLPGLVTLDLSCNLVTQQGLKLLVDSVAQSRAAAADTAASPASLQVLEQLDLSCNQLGDSCTPQVAGLLAHCPLLTSLRLTSAQFTPRFFQMHRKALLESFQGAEHLQELDVSCNQLGPTGLELLLKSLPQHSLKRLHLAATTGPPAPSTHTRATLHLASYLTQDHCGLQALHLSGCHLEDPDIAELIRGLKASRVSTLDLEANPGLTRRSLEVLLAVLIVPAHSLASLHMAGCRVESPLGDGVLGLMDHNSARAICTLELPSRYIDRKDQQALEEIWCQQTDALFVSAGHKCIMCFLEG